MAKRLWVHQTTDTEFASVGDDNAMGLWRLIMDKDNGEKHATVFPHFTLEARVAEYGFDPEDVDGILDIIIHEQFLNDGDHPDLPTLFKAKHQQEAREAHIERIRRTKESHTLVVPHSDPKRLHPFHPIRLNHRITSEGIQRRKNALHAVTPSHLLKPDNRPQPALRHEERYQLMQAAQERNTDG